jgi:hypothetical protein
MIRKLSFCISALASPRVLLGLGLVVATTLFGGTGCGLSYSLTGLYILPASQSTCIPPASVAQFKAYGTYTEGGHSMRTEDISDQVTWTASLPELATVDTSGLATSGISYVGLTPIIATTRGEFGNLTASSNLQVSSTCTGAAIVTQPFTLHIVPSNQNLTVGQDLQPLAIAFDSPGGRSTDLSRQVIWTSSNVNVAMIAADGTIRAIAPGDVTVTALRRTSSGATVSATQTIHIQSAQNQ